MTLRSTDAVADAGVSVWMVWSVDYDDNGQVTRARFEINAGEFDRFAYLYDPRDEIDKDPNPDSIVIRQIDDAWWFLSEDWN